MKQTETKKRKSMPIFVQVNRLILMKQTENIHIIINAENTTTVIDVMPSLALL